MTDQELLGLAQYQDLVDALAHPDPDPETLPAAIPPELVSQEQTASHILRASLHLEDQIETLKMRRDQDMADWGLAIAKLQSKKDAWRAMIRDWMLRTDTQKIQTPWYTASIGKPRTKKVVLDEEAAIALGKRIYPAAVKVKYQLVKAEVDVMADTFPVECLGIIGEETGEPTLLVRRRT